MTAVLKKKLALVKSRIVKYCSSLNVEVPKVISTEEAHENWRIENRNKMAHGADRPRIADRFGACYRKQNTVFINTEKLKDAKKLDKVIRRELINLAKPSYYPTRPIFRDRMNRLLVGDVRNGRFFKASKASELVSAKG